MSYELPQDFKYGMYSNGTYLSDNLFKLNGKCIGLYEFYGALSVKLPTGKSLRLETIQDLNNIKSYVLNNKGEVNWSEYQNVLITLNSLTKNYSIYRGGGLVLTVSRFLGDKIRGSIVC